MPLPCAALLFSCQLTCEIAQGLVFVDLDKQNISAKTQINATPNLSFVT